jgi:hypothetical protein
MCTHAPEFRRATSASATTPSSAASGLLRIRTIDQQKHDKPASQHLEELPPVDIESIPRLLVQFVLLRRNRQRVRLVFSHAGFPPIALPASLIAATIRWYTPQRQMFRSSPARSPHRQAPHSSRAAPRRT